MELVRNAFTARAVEALGWQRSRLKVLGDLVQGVPVRRLIYRSTAKVAIKRFDRLSF